ncbi:hypothetical protein FACS189473_0280 [Spirochaetia bacterium]|nr:hypothetical protein FACS189473_0280 [Spirochaetia bacterium]
MAINMSIKMKKTDVAIIALILAGVLAACQNPIKGYDMETPTTGVDTGSTSSGGGPVPPTPRIALYWDGDESAERTGDTIIWPAVDLGARNPATVTRAAKAVFKNPPAGFEYLLWTLETDTNARADVADDGLLAFDYVWHKGAQDKGSSEMPINAGLGVTTAKITVWNCDSTGTRGKVSSSFTLDVVEFGTPIPPTLKISWDGDNLSHNNETLTWWSNSGPLDLTAAITDPPGGPQVRWTISDPAVVFEGYTAGDPVSPGTAVKIKPGVNFGTGTVTITAALDGYPGVTESFTIIPGPTLKISWDGDNLSHNGETLTWWTSSGPLDLTAAITNPPAGPKVRWTISGPAVVFEGYTAGDPVSPGTAVKIKPGVNFGTGTVTVTAVLDGYPEVTESFTIIPGPTLKISWDGDNLSHNGETLSWWSSSGPLDLAAAITNPPNGPKVRWTISGPANVVVFEGYTAGDLVSPGTAVKIKPGVNFGTATATNPVTITAALGGYPGVTGSFTIIPGPTIALYWKDDISASWDVGDTPVTGTVTWPVWDSQGLALGGSEAKAKAKLMNAPPGFDHLQWSFNPPYMPLKDDAGLLLLGSNTPQPPSSSEMSIRFDGAGTTTATIHVWNCDAQGNRGSNAAEASFTVEVTAKPYIALSWTFYPNSNQRSEVDNEPIGVKVEWSTGATQVLGSYPEEMTVTAVLHGASAGYDYLQWSFAPFTSNPLYTARMLTLEQPVAGTHNDTVAIRYDYDDPPFGTSSVTVYVRNCDINGNPGTLKAEFLLQAGY